MMDARVTMAANPHQITLAADQLSDQAAREDLKLQRAMKSDAIKSRVRSARTKVKKNKKEAEERLEAVRDRLNGGFWGTLIGAICAVVCAVASVMPGVGAVAAAALIAIGAALSAVASKAGEKVGNDMSEDNEVRATNAAKDAGTAEIQEKQAEEKAEDLRDRIKQVGEARRQVFDDARERRRELNRALMG